MDAGCVCVSPIAKVPYVALPELHQYSFTSVKTVLPPREVLEPVKPRQVLGMVLSLA